MISSAEGSRLNEQTLNGPCGLRAVDVALVDVQQVLADEVGRFSECAL